MTDVPINVGDIYAIEGYPWPYVDVTYGAAYPCAGRRHWRIELDTGDVHDWDPTAQAWDMPSTKQYLVRRNELPPQDEVMR